MQRFARIQEGIVVELFDLPDTIPELVTPASDDAEAVYQDRPMLITDLFPPSMDWRPAGEQIEIGWIFDGAFHEPPPPVPSQAELIAYAADQRWQIEVGGIMIAGVPIATDDRSKTMILGARVAAAANPEWETVWHGSDGQTYPLNAASMIAISNAVEAHVNGTFAIFAGAKADIDSGQITTRAEVDAAFA